MVLYVHDLFHSTASRSLLNNENGLAGVNPKPDLALIVFLAPPMPVQPEKLNHPN